MSPMPPEDVKELYDKVVEFLKLHRNHVSDWRHFPFDAIAFGEYTGERLKTEWDAVLKNAMKFRTIELDLERVDYYLKMTKFVPVVPPKPKAAAKKRGTTAYALFVSDFCKDHVNTVGRKKFELASQAWKTSNDETRKKYADMAIAKNAFLEEKNAPSSPAKRTLHNFMEMDLNSTFSYLNKNAADRSAKNKKAKGKMKKDDFNYDVAFNAYCEAKSEKYASKYGDANLKPKLQQKFLELDEEKQKNWYQYAITSQRAAD